MFIFGYLYFVLVSEVDCQVFDIYLCYWVLEVEVCLVVVYFDMEGWIDGQFFSESFELLCDVVVYFVSCVSCLVWCYGLCLWQGLIVCQCCEYDVMFDDLC